MSVLKRVRNAFAGAPRSSRCRPSSSRDMNSEIDLCHDRDADRDNSRLRLCAHPKLRRRAAHPHGCSPALMGRDADDRPDEPRKRPLSPRVAVSRKTSTPSEAYFTSVPPTPDSSSGCASTAVNPGVRMISVIRLSELAGPRQFAPGSRTNLISDQAAHGCEITVPKLCGCAPSGANCAVVRGPQ